MTAADVARLLALAAAFDQRTVGREDVAAWASVIGTLDVEDAAHAIRDHYADPRASTRRVMPSDVLERCRLYARQRLSTRALPPPRVDPDDPAAYRAALASQVAAAASRRGLLEITGGTQ